MRKTIEIIQDERLLNTIAGGAGAAVGLANTGSVRQANQTARHHHRCHHHHHTHDYRGFGDRPAVTEADAKITVNVGVWDTFQKFSTSD